MSVSLDVQYFDFVKQQIDTGPEGITGLFSDFSHIRKFEQFSVDQCHELALQILEQGQKATRIFLENRSKLKIEAFSDSRLKDMCTKIVCLGEYAAYRLFSLFPLFEKKKIPDAWQLTLLKSMMALDPGIREEAGDLYKKFVYRDYFLGEIRGDDASCAEFLHDINMRECSLTLEECYELTLKACHVGPRSAKEVLRHLVNFRLGDVDDSQKVAFLKILLELYGEEIKDLFVLALFSLDLNKLPIKEREDFAHYLLGKMSNFSRYFWCTVFSHLDLDQLEDASYFSLLISCLLKMKKEEDHERNLLQNLAATSYSLHARHMLALITWKEGSEASSLVMYHHKKFRLKHINREMRDVFICSSPALPDLIQFSTVLGLESIALAERVAIAKSLCGLPDGKTVYSLRRIFSALHLSELQPDPHVELFLCLLEEGLSVESDFFDFTDVGKIQRASAPLRMALVAQLIKKNELGSSAVLTSLRDLNVQELSPEQQLELVETLVRENHCSMFDIVNNLEYFTKLGTVAHEKRLKLGVSMLKKDPSVCDYEHFALLNLTNEELQDNLQAKWCIFI